MNRAAVLSELHPGLDLARPSGRASREGSEAMPIKIAALSHNPETLRCLNTLMQQETLANHWHLCAGETVRETGQLNALVEQERPDILLLEDEGREDEMLDALQEIVDRHAELTVILASARQTPEFLLRALRAGVREIVPLPVTTEALRKTVGDIRQRIAASRIPRAQGKIMAWMSCKGGAGATFLATNLGAALAATGKRVCFIDLNAHFGEASLYVTEARPEKTLADVLQQIQRLDGPLLESSMLRIAPNFWLLAAPDSPEAIGEIRPNGIDSLLNVARANFDFVILDISRMLDAESIRALDQADEIHLVIQMALPFLRDATRLLRIFSSLGYPAERIRVLVNRFEKDGDISLKELEQTLEMPIAQTVPNSFAAVAVSINQGRPIIELAPQNPVARTLQEIARAQAAIEAPGESWLNRLLRRSR